MDKLTFFRSTIEERLIDLGRVGCPLHAGDVDIEQCARCGSAIALELDATPPVVRCRPPRFSWFSSGMR